MAARAIIHRARLASLPQPGLSSFALPCHKLVFEYSESWASNRGLRDFLANDVVEFARSVPSVEVIVKQRKAGHPIVRGHYVNGRDKVICLRGLEGTGVQQKVKLLVDASGQKLRRIKAEHPVQSTNESVRGMWSAFHTPLPSESSGRQMRNKGPRAIAR
ncbi:uncharacterized protein L969DRAFT_91128 [Mixia osmundae IAM 14324]|uniref:uncharacterized protein n=1 Tax=Mixia osmundae (strain CBS 9802 / IAM 14324 / JCM 22182 / KY 12970) TaxID=764103 RepID=UPI0004A548E9|nr:uncharacterized protein L969DRAFT_91128 [Mixia osmundae IAM 14324]KEI36282.1 hypothetical protein L969DRAFT_91128 [Mixia osmundae IAM 14324]